MRKKINKVLGHRLKSAREEKKLSQLDMAIFLHCSIKDVRRYEAGFKPLTTSKFFRVCDHLGVKPTKVIIGTLGDWFKK